jgi:hypothetical protein
MNLENSRNFLFYLLAYLFWAVSIALAVVDLLVLRSTVMIVLGMTAWDRYVEHALNQFGFLLLAVLSLAFIIFTEYFFRTGVEQGRLFARFFLVVFIGVLILTLSHVVRLVGEVVLGFFSPTTLVIMGAEIAICALLFWLWQRFQPRKQT